MRSTLKEQIQGQVKVWLDRNGIGPHIPVSVCPDTYRLNVGHATVQAIRGHKWETLSGYISVKQF